MSLIDQYFVEQGTKLLEEQNRRSLKQLIQQLEMNTRPAELSISRLAGVDLSSGATEMRSRLLWTLSLILRDF